MGRLYRHGPSTLYRHRPRSYTSAAQVRGEFLDYFRGSTELPHTVVPPSPVLPHNDPSLAFVNSGMVQFKPVFQGWSPAPCPRAVNSQRCVRVGGRHNDLAVVMTAAT